MDFLKQFFLKKYYAFSDSDTKNILGKANRFKNFFIVIRKFIQRSLTLLLAYLGKPDLSTNSNVSYNSRDILSESI